MDTLSSIVPSKFLHNPTSNLDYYCWVEMQTMSIARWNVNAPDNIFWSYCCCTVPFILIGCSSSLSCSEYWSNSLSFVMYLLIYFPSIKFVRDNAFCHCPILMDCIVKRKISPAGYGVKVVFFMWSGLKLYSNSPLWKQNFLPSFHINFFLSLNNYCWTNTLVSVVDWNEIKSLLWIIKAYNNIAEGFVQWKIKFLKGNYLR